jgi:hydroxymethylpyrimidine pyrophosphatase-like HAD family hydrolase
VSLLSAEPKPHAYDDLREEARRRITASCLLASDIDQTLLKQSTPHERQDFMLAAGPKLVEAAHLGAHLAFLTGNSMHELCSRFLNSLIHLLCQSEALHLLSQFHFLCNSGGVYAHISPKDAGLQAAIDRGRASGHLAEHVFREITTCAEIDSKLSIRPRFLHGEYIERSSIPENDVARIHLILEMELGWYLREVAAKRQALSKMYRLEEVLQPGEQGEFIEPGIDLRLVAYGEESASRKATVQITVKPILSFRHARQPERMFGQDIRTRFLERVQAKLDACGLGYYVARPGGRSSVDVTKAKLDKEYGLRFLIDLLNVQGQERQGRKLGSNTIYFGDEVIVGGGNDYPVTRIPGVLVFAVNSDRALVPLLSDVFVPSAVLDGPDATAQILTQFNNCAQRLISTYIRCGDKMRCSPVTQTAVDALKEEIFAARIQNKIASLRATGQARAEQWQMLNTLITLMCRDDPLAREWLSILMEEFDAIMKQQASRGGVTPLAIGNSHEDSRVM